MFNDVDPHKKGGLCSHQMSENLDDRGDSPQTIVFHLSLHKTPFKEVEIKIIFPATETK